MPSRFRLGIRIELLDTHDLEAVLLAEFDHRVKVTFVTAPEPRVLPEHNCTCTKEVNKVLAHELLGAQLRKLEREVDIEQVFDTRFAHEGISIVVPRDQHRLFATGHDVAGMRMESEGARRKVVSARVRHERVDDAAVTTVNAVKVPDRHHARSEFTRNLMRVAPHARGGHFVHGKLSWERIEHMPP